MYSIQLPNFEGPLDLLLFFIKRDELDIHDIPIARITAEFLDYTRFIELLDLELAGEFIVMASTLMQIKAKMLLPKVSTDDDTTEDDDPRAELVRRLLEYKRYKEAAERLGTMSVAQQHIYRRQFFAADVRATPSAEDEFRNVTLFDLIAAFSKALKRVPKAPPVHNIVRESVTIEQQAQYILALFEYRAELTFAELITSDTEFAADRFLIVTTFLALLELIRSRAVGIRQSEQFAEIVIFQRGLQANADGSDSPNNSKTAADKAYESLGDEAFRASEDYEASFAKRRRKPKVSTEASAETSAEASAEAGAETHAEIEATLEESLQTA
jgi:segregation and condensation protein A